MATEAVHPSVNDGQSARLRKRLSRLSGRLRVSPALELAVVFLALVAAAAGFLSLTNQFDTRTLGPLGQSLFLAAVILPFMGLVILAARRIALAWLDRKRGLIGARLHVRLLGLFAVLAAGPTILTVVFASLLFQSGTQFWFSDNAQTVLRNAEEVAQAYVTENRDRIVGDIFSMAVDVYDYSRELGPDSALFADGVAWQLAARNLSEAMIFTPLPDGTIKVMANAEGEGALGEQAVVAERLTRDVVTRAALGETAVLAGRDDRVEAVVRLHPSSNLFLYASRAVDQGAVQAASQAATARSEYSGLLQDSRDLQWRFNAMLAGVAILVIFIAILSALWLANRLTAPIARMASAAERVGQGDLGARVEVRYTPDELGLLARSFNRMAAQLEAQTGALMSATESAEARRRFIETVVEGVSAGVIAIDTNGEIELVSSRAIDLLGAQDSPLARQEDLDPEFGALLARARSGTAARGEVEIERNGETKTFLVRVDAVAGDEHSHVITFDDVTQQIADQRRAAWADVARRIAHEIKNPLTPIQLSAERLQRRIGKKVEGDDKRILDEMTATIMRQVGDLRRMVDEFSSFARMPKPSFKLESLRELARQAIFLQEVSKPDIGFSLSVEEDVPPVPCDGRQIGQAMTNLIKNAAEAIEGDAGRDLTRKGEIEVTIRQVDADHVALDICDNGPGMTPDFRERATEPYVTTREGGTGLGLAIVNKVAQDHGGELLLRDREGGGTCARIVFDLKMLNEMKRRNPEAGVRVREETG